MNRHVIFFCMAGGNLIAAAMTWMIQNGLREFLPSRSVLVYPVLNLSLAPAASRFLAAFDAILPYPSLKVCARAYVPSASDVSSDPLLSPGVTPSDILAFYPPTVIVAAQLDPLLDEALMFARRLKIAGCDVSFAAMPDCPHAFLHLGPVCGGDVARGVAYVMNAVTNAVSNVVTLRIKTEKRNHPLIEVHQSHYFVNICLTCVPCRLPLLHSDPLPQLFLKSHKSSTFTHHRSVSS
jgi:acetyl esterase/lipase